ncbi:hypothetical protein LTR17_019115 [Elasticomyces elasticus]|nr:hypothetical protein LTR17_019115 [Elasticomyces elasticus]
MRLSCNDLGIGWMDGDQSIPQPIIYEHPFMTLLFDDADKALSICANHPRGRWTKCLIAQPVIVGSKLETWDNKAAKHEDTIKDSKGLVIGALKLNEQEDAAPASNAALKVFGTVELAEIIFLGLSMRDVLTSTQRVCREWKSIIEGSKPIQQALFQTPVSNERVAYRDSDASEQQFSREIMNHPMLTWELNVRPGQRSSDFVKWLCKEHLQGSWRKHLATQPPISELSMWTFRDGSLITVAGGITLEDLDLPRISNAANGQFGLDGWNWECRSSLTDELRDLRARMLAH